MDATVNRQSGFLTGPSHKSGLNLGFRSPKRFAFPLRRSQTSPNHSELIFDADLIRGHVKLDGLFDLRPVNSPARKFSPHRPAAHAPAAAAADAKKFLRCMTQSTRFNREWNPDDERSGEVPTRRYKHYRMLEQGVAKCVWARCVWARMNLIDSVATRPTHSDWPLAGVRVAGRRRYCRWSLRPHRRLAFHPQDQSGHR